MLLICSWQSLGSSVRSQNGKSYNFAINVFIDF
jgi:hypothetical protein